VEIVRGLLLRGKSTPKHQISAQQTAHVHDNMGHLPEYTALRLRCRSILQCNMPLCFNFNCFQSFHGVQLNIYIFQITLCIILSRIWVTVNRVWIGYWTYRPLIDCNYNYGAIANSNTLQFTTACNKSFPSSVPYQSLLGNGFNGGRSPYSGYLNYPRPSAISF
jgi:hypothetical protein